MNIGHNTETGTPIMLQQINQSYDPRMRLALCCTELSYLLLQNVFGYVNKDHNSANVVIGTVNGFRLKCTDLDHNELNRGRSRHLNYKHSS